jgi:ribosomal protein S18 acetylase RimI-like enzyme
MFRIKKATTDDCQLIHDMAWKVFPDTYKEILSKEQNDYMMEWMYSLCNLKKQMTEEEHVYLIAYDGNAPVGYVSVQPQSANMFHLQKIYVLPEMQGRQCGRFLFEEAVKYIRQVHPTPCTMELNVNRNNRAVTFYEKLGMKKVRQGDYDIGNGFFMNDYIMGMEI